MKKDLEIKNSGTRIVYFAKVGTGAGDKVAEMTFPSVSCFVF